MTTRWRFDLDGFTGIPSKLLAQMLGKRKLRTEYHARRMEGDPKKWKVVEVAILGGEVYNARAKELATDLKRNHAEAMVKLLRSNKQES